MDKEDLTQEMEQRAQWLHQLGQPIAPSILFPVFNPPYPQGTVIVLWYEKRLYTKCNVLIPILH